MWLGFTSKDDFFDRQLVCLLAAYKSCHYEIYLYMRYIDIINTSSHDLLNKGLSN